jgi:hypothetical protein
VRVEALKALLKDKHQPTQGKKKDLIERLLQFQR